MVKKELKLKTLHAVQIADLPSPEEAEIVRPILKLKHLQRFQTRISQAFEEILDSEIDSEN